MRSPLRLAAALAAACAAALTGCGSPASSPAPASAAAFPVTVKAGNGAVTISSEPARIVSLSPTLTEDLYKIGADGQVVAVDSDSDYPAGVPKTSLSGLTP